MKENDPAPGLVAAPPTGAALVARLDAIRDATLDRVRRRERAGLMARLAVGGGGLLAVALAAVLFVTNTGLTHGSGPAPFAGTPTASAQAGLEAPATPTPLCSGASCFGLSGATGWALRGSTLSTTVDGGATWQQRVLPAQLRDGFQQASLDTAGDVVAVAATGSAQTIIVAVSAHGSASWAVSSYTPKYAAAALATDPTPTPPGPAPAALLALSPGGAKAMLVAQVPIGSSTVRAVLASADGGRTFTQRSSDVGDAWRQLSIGDSGTAYAVSDAAAFQVQASTDSGTTWTDTGVVGTGADSWTDGAPSLIDAPQSRAGGPEWQVRASMRAVNSRVELQFSEVAASTTASGQDAESTAGGLVLAVTASGVVHPTSAVQGDRVLALVGGALWSAPSMSTGATWTKTTTTGLPAGTAFQPLALAFSSAKNGLVWVGDGTAADLYATSDGGRTWSPADFGGAIASLPQPNGGSGTDASAAASAVSAILTKIALPPAAVKRSASPAALLDRAPQSIGCRPLVDGVEWFAVPDQTPQALLAWLTAHNGALARFGGTGSSGTASSTDLWWVTGDEVAGAGLAQGPQVLFTAVAAAHGSSLRVDAQAVPQGASCASAGGASSAG
ncbi:MAG: hypothetical protein FWD85_10535 [Microbacteriaceae bacterium]|nr:hypothetical protein [Microbacteriaceae bacterium]MCL2795733.1 hypothetical protein [Microbacteriaceae bacterium]